MLCPLCKKSDTRVLDSRDEETFVRRRRECLKCRYRFTTFERSNTISLKVIKRDGSYQDYDRNKLSRGIKLALEKRPFNSDQINHIISTLEQEIVGKHKKEISSKEIGDIAINKLRNIDEVAYLRFVSVFKKFGSAKKFQKEAEKFF